MDERRRAQADPKVNELYEALIGTPKQAGFLEYARAEFKSIEAWQKDHTEEHEAREQGAAEVRRTWSHLLMSILEKGVIAILAAILGVIIGLISDGRVSPQ